MTAERINEVYDLGLWTAIGPIAVTSRGERKWLCRCACGTERYVLERSLLYGGSKSCGCLRKARAQETNELKLDGKAFGDLKVLHKAASKAPNGGTRWTCECSCGNVVDIPATLLAKGRKTHCGCKTVKNYAYQDIRGKTFNRLTAIEPLDKRDYKGGLVWLCECSCGNFVEVPYNWLVYSDVKSCGCQKKEHDAKLGELLAHVGGTSIDSLRNKTIPLSNTTGVRGVYRKGTRYMAKIVFQKRQYHLGTYDTIEDAAWARQIAEEALFDVVVEHYDRWKAKADAEPEWAEANPIEFIVSKGQGNELEVTCLPEL